MASTTDKTLSFSWEGTDRKGNKTTGVMAAANSALVKAQLRKQGIKPVKVKKAAATRAKGKKITPFDVAIFTRQLATMMKAGVPLIQAFDIVADGLENPSLQTLVIDIKNEVAAGNNFAGALRKHPQHFGDLFCNLVDSGEKSGALETMLDRVATYMETTEALKKKVKKAMSYPISVLVVSFIVTTILLVKVVPTFDEMFKGFGAELPAFTQFVVGLSEWMQEYWFILILTIAGLVFAFKQASQRSEAFRDASDKAKLKIPIVGPIIEKSSIARFARVLSTTFSAGVPLVDALDSVAGATGNIVYRNAVFKVRDDVASGTQLQYSMRSTGVFPSMAVQMVSIGEESGALDTMLDKVATHFEDEVDDLVDNMTALMEPIIMSVLGVLIGGLIIAMYLPIFQMGAVV
ncbi:type II secretion system protein F [Oleiphilus sp. HI0081]|nr:MULTISPECIES: type II secretion system F family protein [unclassified Oleiphilus]KZY73315.1 type II secretion system protein F [Oleiphilus sp. HI0068]KZY79365.1 type II secretion system protein F [Oleiphilus sp. HI0069]KZZ21217.1 type II secretion system protein F [Oleiphilus sp. HI0078]KZZ21457.1 type II secretion system protein F [Oleiphilus sp. HI0081]KZY36682.1 type II secretion system protein F [Oleiphilus sp. HI0043]